MGRFLVGLALVAVLSSPAAAQAGRVIGRVTDGVGNAVSDARVALVSADSTAVVRTETTGETGGFEFARVAPGPYTLRVERAGYRVREMQVDLQPGGRETLIARLGPARPRERLVTDRRQEVVQPRP
jgi:protocatechuate 3,4-dioxygenase beta subunit